VSGKLADQANWVQRVLGVTLSASAPSGGVDGTSPVRNAGTNGAAPGWQTARQAWQDANDVVNDQINGLRKALLNRARDGDDGMDGLADALSEIAEKGLNAITEDHRVKLMASMMELGGGDAATVGKFGAKAFGLITAFQTFLDSSEKIEVCDANPFDAPVSIRTTLGPPLQQMVAALQAATAR
jgi:hypothetical protein